MSQTCGAHHAYVNAAIGAAAIWLIARPVRNRVTTAFAVAGLGLASLLVCLIVDLPAITDSGRWPQLYSNVQVQVGNGTLIELTAAAALLSVGVALLRLEARGRLSDVAHVLPADRPVQIADGG